MLVVAGTITYDPAHQQEVIAAAGRVAELTRRPGPPSTTPAPDLPSTNSDTPL